jgi:hypothetical protein
MIGIESLSITPPNEFGVIVQRTSLDNFKWYKDIIFYSKSSQFPPRNVLKRKKKFETNHYVLVYGVLFK